jgi:hypothetical protein
MMYRRDSNSAAFGRFTMVGLPYYGAVFTDVAVGRNGSVWALDNYPVPGGHRMFSWDGAYWHQEVAGGGAVRIAVDEAGVPWVVNNANGIYRRTSKNWWEGGFIQLPGAGYDIAVNPGSLAWIIGTNSVPGGFGVYSWSEQLWTWTGLAVSSGGLAISVGVNGDPWVATSGGYINRPPQ